MTNASRRYKIVAHRGASAYEPENTLRAFSKAIELGADMSELDLHTSRDGHLIVMHDSNVETTTDGRGRVTDLTLEQIKALHADKGERVPTLLEVLDLVRGRHGLYIELKGTKTPVPLVNVLRANHVIDRSEVIVGSFEPDLVREVKVLAPEISTSILVRPVLTGGELIEEARRVGADFVHPCWERRDPHPHRLLTPELLDTVHAAGLGIVLWHEERPEELQFLRQLDVDAICTNTPDALL
jgi:glycerophosphoryl diester phosphodiesterase